MILPRKVAFSYSLIHTLMIYTLIYRLLQQKLPILYIVKLVTFTCGIEFCILTITQNVTIFTVADIYEQEPTSSETVMTVITLRNIKSTVITMRNIKSAVITLRNIKSYTMCQISI